MSETRDEGAGAAVDKAMQELGGQARRMPSLGVGDARCPPPQMIYEWDRLSELGLVSLSTQAVIALRIAEL